MVELINEKMRRTILASASLMSAGNMACTIKIRRDSHLTFLKQIILTCFGIIPVYSRAKNVCHCIVERPCNDLMLISSICTNNEQNPPQVNKVGIKKERESSTNSKRGRRQADGRVVENKEVGNSHSRE